MSIKKYNFIVTQEIEIEVDESKFTDKFIKEFKTYMYNFNDKEIYRLILNKKIVKKGNEYFEVSIKTFFD